jgi:hypothetical protein
MLTLTELGTSAGSLGCMGVPSYILASAAVQPHLCPPTHSLLPCLPLPWKTCTPCKVLPLTLRQVSMQLAPGGVNNSVTTCKPALLQEHAKDVICL